MADNKDVRKILKNIEKFIKNGKFQNAINEYLKLLQINPKDLSAINQLGDLYVRVGNYREAYKYYKKLAEYYERTDVIPKSIAIYRKIYRLDPKNIEVEVKDNVLRVEAKQEEKKEEKRKGYYRKEMSKGYYKRAVPLPVEVVGEKATADYQEGILKVVIPKQKPKKETKKGVKVKVKGAK